MSLTELNVPILPVVSNAHTPTCTCISNTCNSSHNVGGVKLVAHYTQVNKKFRKFGRKYRDCIKRNGDKIGTQTSYDIST